MSSLGAPQATWASVTNGIFICLNCSGLHRGFGVSASFVRSTKMDSWSEKQLNFMILGGNKNLKDYFKSLNFPESAPLDFKYKTKAGQYYRDRLKAMVEDRELPIPPTEEEAYELIDYSNPYFMSKPKEERRENQEFYQEKKEKNKKNYLNEIKHFMEETYEKTAHETKQAMEKVKKKMNDPSIKEDFNKFANKSKEFSEKGLNYAKKGYESMKKGFFNAFDFLAEKPKKNNQNVQKDENIPEKTEKTLDKKEEKIEYPAERQEGDNVNYQDYFQSFENGKPEENTTNSDPNFQKPKGGSRVVVEAPKGKEKMQKDEDLLDMGEDAWNH